MDLPERCSGTTGLGRIRSVISRLQRRHTTQRVAALLTAFLPPLVQIQLPSYAVGVALAVLGLALLRR